MSDLVALRREGGVAHVRLARPEVRNALSSELLAELTQTFDELAGDPSLRVVTLGGEGRDFCAGADLDDMRRLGQATPDENRADARRLSAAFSAIADLPRPVVARVQGNVFGGGCGLVAACDVSVVAEGARFAFSEVRLGIVPAVISPYVIRRIGPAKAQSLFLTGDRFDASDAVRVGLCDSLCTPDTLDESVDRVVASLTAGSPDAQARIKRMVREVAGRPLAEASELTPDFIADARASADGQEGLTAFFEKRKPSWAEPESSRP